MALVSSGAFHSCEDHLQNPRSVSAARLESLAFIQAQNGNASNSSVLPAASSFIFFSPLPQLRFPLTPLPQEGEVSLLGSSAHLAYFSASALCRECAPLSSTLLLPLCLAFTTTAFWYHHHPLHPNPQMCPLHLFPTLWREEQNLWRVSCALNPFLSLDMCMSIFCIFLSSLLFCVKTVEQARARYRWCDGEMKGETLACIFSKKCVVIHFLWLLLNNSSVSCAIK